MILARLLVQNPTVTVFFFSLVGLLSVGSQGAVAQAQDPNTPEPHTKTKKRKVRTQSCIPPQIYGPKDSGDVIEGPVCVAVGYNALRYLGVLVQATIVSAGQNLPGGLTPLAGFGQAPAAPRAPLQLPRVPDTLDAIQEGYDAAYKEFYIVREKANADNSAIVGQAVSDLKDRVAASDQIYATAVGSGGPLAGATAVMTTVNDLKAKIQKATEKKWVTSDDIYQALRALELGLQDYAFHHTAPTDQEKAQLDQLKINIAAIQTDVANARAGGSSQAAFQAQYSIVSAWKAYLDRLDESSFILKTYIGCGILFNQNRQIAVSLSLTDQLPSFTGTALTPGDARNPFVTVNCASPFIVSAGVEFSFLSTPTIGLVPSGATGENQFGITDTANISPLPIGMVSGRIAEWQNHRFGVYGSFGTAAHVQGSGTGGSSVEFLTGLSVGLLRTIYITPGWHLGKVSSLTGGYKVGDPVPSGVTVAPVKSTYASGFGLAITFTKP